jgi:hypothetical protein
MLKLNFENLKIQHCQIHNKRNKMHMEDVTGNTIKSSMGIKFEEDKGDRLCLKIIY